MAPILDIVGLSKSYAAGPQALSDVTLSIEPGEIFALLGPNGAGKTTLIGAVCGLVKKTAGTIRIFGQDLDVDPVKPRFDIGLVPQEVNFDPFFTVAESLHIQAGYYGRPRDEGRVMEVLKALALDNKAHAQTRALSGGMRRRLLIAKALVHKPKLLFLDEPTAGVDVELRHDLWQYVRKLRAEGTTIVLTTHYLEEAEELADRVGIIDKGRLQLVESTASLLKRLGERRLVVQLTKAVTPNELPAAAKDAGAQLGADGMQLSYTERPGKPPIGEFLRALYVSGLPLGEVETRKSRLEDVLLQVLRGAPAPGDARLTPVTQSPPATSEAAPARTESPR